MLYSQHGILAYLAPEILYGFPYNQKIDVWALGVMLFALIFHKFPFGAHRHAVS